MSISFIAFFIFGMLISCITSVTQHLPGYGESLGFPIIPADNKIAHEVKVIILVK